MARFIKYHFVQTLDSVDVLCYLYIFFIPYAQELELVEDAWRGEVQDLLSQITQLQAENKRLLVSLSLKELPVTEEDLQKPEGGLSAASTLNRGLTDGVWEVSTKIRYGIRTSFSF